MPLRGMPPFRIIGLAVVSVIVSKQRVKDTSGFSLTVTTRGGDVLPSPQWFSPVTVIWAIPEKESDQEIVTPGVFPVTVPASEGVIFQLYALAFAIVEVV